MALVLGLVLVAVIGAVVRARVAVMAPAAERPETATAAAKPQSRSKLLALASAVGALVRACGRVIDLQEEGEEELGASWPVAAASARR